MNCIEVGKFGIKMGSTQENDYNCSTCSTKKQLSNHILTHDPGAKLKCQVCGKVSKSSKALSRHVSMYHANRERPSCDICLRVFSTAKHLRTHIATVHSTLKRPSFSMRVS
ncbi:Zinc finger and BTB domain-containing protein 21 [Folsomia candida]|uniref:Zinc finger and BTB domain-containing protein 21 n=1 Tax=Folsomia candida TaxID=158441 RepID=A0A226DQ54_FOLCA|nr:Zinc finger and BTB domain-containing protein 21 [Folsomia candida]